MGVISRVVLTQPDLETLAHTLTFIRSVQELRILGGRRGKRRQLCSVALSHHARTHHTRAGDMHFRVQPLSGRLNSQEGQISWTREAAGFGDGSRAHLSFTSSFTPELSWRAWLIMSCTQ